MWGNIWQGMWGQEIKKTKQMACLYAGEEAVWSGMKNVREVYFCKKHKLK